MRSPPGTSASGTRKTLSGLRSRWTMPLAWAAVSAPAIWRVMERALWYETRPRRARADSDSPCRCSITMYAVPSVA